MHVGRALPLLQERGSRWPEPSIGLPIDIAWMVVRTGMGTQSRAACLSGAPRSLLCRSDGSDLGLVPPRPVPTPSLKKELLVFPASTFSTQRLSSSTPQARSTGVCIPQSQTAQGRMWVCTWRRDHAATKAATLLSEEPLLG